MQMKHGIHGILHGLLNVFVVKKCKENICKQCRYVNVFVVKKCKENICKQCTLKCIYVAHALALLALTADSH